MKKLMKLLIVLMAIIFVLTCGGGGGDTPTINTTILLTVNTVKRNFYFLLRSLYEKKLATSMRMKLFPSMTEVRHPRTGTVHKIKPLDKKNPEAIRDAVATVKLIKPKVTKEITTDDAFKKIEAELRQAGVDAERIARFREDHARMMEERPPSSSKRSSRGSVPSNQGISCSLWV